MRRWMLAAPLLICLPGAARAQPELPFGTLREQASVRQAWLEARLERVLPRLVREQGVD